MLLGFCICIFCSFLIVKSKVRADEPSFVITKTHDLKTKEALKVVKYYDASKTYYYKYSINRTYHVGNWGIYTSNDTLSTELKSEEN